MYLNTNIRIFTTLTSVFRSYKQSVPTIRRLIKRIIASIA